MDRGVAIFIARVFSTKRRQDLEIRLGARLILAKFGLVSGPIFSVLNFIMTSILGFLKEEASFRIDLALDSWREGTKLKDFETEAKAEYDKVTAKIYSEEEKNVIRKQYLELIAKFGAVGLGPNPKRMQ